MNNISIKRCFLAIVLLAVAAVTATTGCTKDNRPSYSSYAFRVRCRTAPLTRTYYTGQESAEGKWIAFGRSMSPGVRDTIRIMGLTAKAESNSAINYCDYTVHGGTPENGFLYEVTPVSSPDSLRIEDKEETWYGMYPSPEMLKNEVSGVFLSDTQMGGTIPTVQGFDKNNQMVIPSSEDTTVTLWTDMRYAYMFASKEGNARSNRVTLDFEPMYTAFCVSIRFIGAGYNDHVNILQVRLDSESRPLSGSFKYNYADGSYEYLDNCEKYVIAAMVANEKTPLTRNEHNSNVNVLTIPCNEVWNLVFFALPGAENYDDLTLSVMGPEIGTRRLELRRDDVWVSFKPNHFNRINGVELPETLSLQWPDIGWGSETCGEGIRWVEWIDGE